MQKAEEHDVQFVEAGENTAEALESAKESLDFIAAAIQSPVIFPGLQAPARRWDDGSPTKIQGQLACLLISIGAIHKQRQRCG